MGGWGTFLLSPVFKRRRWERARRQPQTLSGQPLLPCLTPQGFKVMQIEVSNECSLACAYCPHPSQIRAKGIMKLDVFKKCIELVKRSQNPEIEGRKFVHLNHFGEPLLNPMLPEFIRYASSQNVEVSFSTNGVDSNKRLFPRDLWRELANAGLRGVIVSCHVKSETTLRNHIGDIVKIYYVFQPKPQNMHDWAGQVNIDKYKKNYVRRQVKNFVRRQVNIDNYKKNFVSPIPDTPCDYEKHNMFAITWNGGIAACCYDVEGRVSLTVDDVLERGFVFKKISLCDKCRLGRGDVKMLNDDFALIVDKSKSSEAGQFNPPLAIHATR
jgi:DNA-dependent RNA polymerase auxiliary subunit epsilon